MGWVCWRLEYVLILITIRKDYSEIYVAKQSISVFLSSVPGMYEFDKGGSVTLKNCGGNYEKLHNLTTPTWQAWYKPLPGISKSMNVIFSKLDI